MILKEMKIEKGQISLMKTVLTMTNLKNSKALGLDKISTKKRQKQPNAGDDKNYKYLLDEVWGPRN